jgi:hypothetical protein
MTTTRVLTAGPAAADAPAAPEPVHTGGVVADGPYWARTSDLRLVEPALSQLS